MHAWNEKAPNGFYHNWATSYFLHEGSRNALKRHLNEGLRFYYYSALHSLPACYLMNTAGSLETRSVGPMWSLLPHKGPVKTELPVHLRQSRPLGVTQGPRGLWMSVSTHSLPYCVVEIPKLESHTCASQCCLQSQWVKSKPKIKHFILGWSSVSEKWARRTTLLMSLTSGLSLLGFQGVPVPSACDQA